MPDTILDNLDGVPEVLHAHFAKTDDGKFKLTQEDVSGLKSALDKERAERKAAKDALAKFADIDPDVYKELITERDGRKEKKLIEAGKVDEVVAERVARLKADSDKQVAELKSTNTGLTSQLEILLIDNALTTAAAKAGVEPHAMEDVLRRGRELFKIRDGKAVPLKDDTIVYGKDGTTAMSMDDWLGELAPTAPHLFKASSGGGSEHKTGPGGAKAQKRSEMTAPQKAKYIGEHGTDAYLALTA